MPDIPALAQTERFPNELAQATDLDPIEREASELLVGQRRQSVFDNGFNREIPAFLSHRGKGFPVVSFFGGQQAEVPVVQVSADDQLGQLGNAFLPPLCYE